MITKELIDRGGSKLEITRLMLEEEVNIPIPRGTWKYYWQSLDSVLGDFNSLRKPVIVRGSHRNDYHGFIDVLPTIRDVVTLPQLESAIRIIEAAAASDDVQVHSEDWGQLYTPEVHVLIQEQSPSKFVGSMLRHPHTGEISIQYFELIGDGRNWPFFARVNEKGIFRPDTKVPIGELERLAELYKAVENSGIVDNEFAQHVEFGLQPLAFYQTRPFKRHRQSEKFEFSEQLDIKAPYILTSECFGITDINGINITFTVADPRDTDFLDNGDTGKGREYGLMLTTKTRESFPIRKRFGNIRVYCTLTGSSGFLTHPDYRLMKKADYSLVGYKAVNVKSYLRTYDVHELQKNFHDSRLFSNGRNALIVPVQYL